MQKDAYSRIVLQIASAAKKDLKQFLVLSNGTDVVMDNWAYFPVFRTMNVNKIWAKFRSLERERQFTG